MAKRPVAVDGASASAVEGVRTATRSPVLDLVTMTTLRRDMATAAPLHRRVMALAPVRTGAVADMDRHRAEVLIAAHRMAAHRTAVPLPTAAHPPHHTVHPTDRLMGHPTATSVQRFESVPRGQEMWFRIWASTTYHGIPHPKLSTRSLCAHYWRVLASANGPDQASHRFRTLPCF